MVQIDQLLREIDELSPAELDVVYQYVLQRRELTGVRPNSNHRKTQPAYQQMADMSDQEIDMMISNELSADENPPA